MKKKNKYYSCHSYPTCILLAKGFTLLDIDKSDPYQWKFVFKNTAELERFVLNFNDVPVNDPLVLVDARRLIEAIKDDGMAIRQVTYTPRQMDNYK